MPPTILKRGKPRADVRAPGEAKKADEVRNCMTCQFMLAGCKDPKKAYGYRCTKWTELPIFDLDLDMEGVLKLGAQQSAERDATKQPKAGSSERTFDDILDLIEEQVSSDLPVAPDFKLNDSDLPTAKNYYEWLAGKDFADANERPLVARQLEIMTNMTGEWCPRCSDVDYVKNAKLKHSNAQYFERVTLLERGKCPSCGAKKATMVNKGELLDPIYLIGIAGQRGFKTSTITALESYYIHRWVKLSDPAATFGVLKQQVLTGTYAALTFSQAQKNIWMPLMNIINDAPWFNRYHALLDDYAERTGADKPLYTKGEMWLIYRHRRLMFALASANRSTLRGDTRIDAIIDELGLWKFGKEHEDKERASGPEVYKSLENQLLTIEGAYDGLIKKGYSDLPKPHLFAISSPMDLNDTIMTLRRQTIDDPRVYSFHRPTWDMNPLLPLSSPFMQSRLRADPVKFWRDYGAEPPLSSSGWITEINNVVPLFHKKRKNAAKVEQKIARLGKENELRTVGRVSARALEYGTLLTLDAGQTNNHFSFAISHHEPNPDNDDAPGTVVIDALGEIIPSMQAPISFNSVYTDILEPLAEFHNVQAVLADHWNSASILSAFESKGVFQKKVKLKYDAFSDARSACYDKTLLFPKLDIDDIEDILATKAETYPARFLGKPVAHLFYQILSVRDTGREVTKGSSCTDDLFRAVILAHWGLQQQEIRDSLIISAPRADSPYVGAVFSGGGGGGGARNSSFGFVGARASHGVGDPSGNKYVTRGDVNTGNQAGPTVGMATSRRS